MNPIGNMRTTPASILADRAARLILESAGPQALTADPRGKVYVEPVHEAAESDLIGVYTRSLGLLGLSRQLTEDLRFEHLQRRPGLKLGRAA